MNVEDYYKVGVDEMKRTISITLDESLIQELDKVKGFCPRSTYINHILEVFLKIKTEDGRLNAINKLLQN